MEHLKSIFMEKIAYIFAAFLLLTVVLLSCSEDVNSQSDISTNNTYLLHANASFGSNKTRGLSLDGKTLNAVWKEGESVFVYDNAWESNMGTLTPNPSATSSTSLSGTITGSIKKDDKLNFLFPRENWDYTGQDGTLESIEAKYDYSKAQVTVSSITGQSINTTDASFTNMQAIVKFIITYSEGTNRPLTELKISAKSGKLVQRYNFNDGNFVPVYGDITVTPPSKENTVYVALCNENQSADTYFLTATYSYTYNGKEYTITHAFEKDGITFTPGLYYEVNVSMLPYVDLSKTTDNYTQITRKSFVTGTMADGKYLVIKDNCSVYLKDVNITAPIGQSAISCGENVTLIVSGTCNLTGGAETYDDINCTYISGAGIYMPKGTIKGIGTINATAGKYSAAIGCDYYFVDEAAVEVRQNEPGAVQPSVRAWINSPSITIEGDVNIKANYRLSDQIYNSNFGYCSGIGAGWKSYMADYAINISTSGRVEAYSGKYAAAIGSSYQGRCGNINISGDGNVHAEAGDFAAAIGAGYGSGVGEYERSCCGDINISGNGSLYARGGGWAAGIGSGKTDYSYDINTDTWSKFKSINVTRHTVDAERGTADNDSHTNSICDIGFGFTVDLTYPSIYVDRNVGYDNYRRFYYNVQQYGSGDNIKVHGYNKEKR